MIEENLLGHFCYFPERLGFEIRTIGKVTAVNCRMRSRNVAYGAGSVEQVMDFFQEEPFTWWIYDSGAMRSKLLERGFNKDRMHCAMICDLTKYEQSELKELAKVEHWRESTVQDPILQVHRVSDDVFLEDFLSVLDTHDPEARNFYLCDAAKVMECREEWLYERFEERLYVGYVTGAAVVIGSFANNNVTNTSSICSLLSMQADCCYEVQLVRYFMYLAKLSEQSHVTMVVPGEKGGAYLPLGFKTSNLESYENK